MKKRVEAELISIAHRILKLKNKSEVDQLYKETQKLYEALTILKFYGDNYETLKEAIPADEIEEKVAAFIDAKEEEVAAPVVVEESVAEVEAVEETAVEEAEEESVIVGEVVVEEDEVEDESFEDNDGEEEPEVEDLVGEKADEENFMPSFELSFEEEKEEVAEAKPSKQVTMDEVMGDHFREPVFVKPDEVTKEETKAEVKETPKEKVTSLNDSLSNTISVGLNDRIGFVKHLFNDSNEDYNRVLSQLNTFDTFEEAKNFLNEMVIPDYNYWVGKEEYLERFMEIVEKKFK